MEFSLAFTQHSRLNQCLSLSSTDACANVSLTFARTKTLAGDVDGGMVNAVVILETARRAVRTIVASAEERRLHHGTFLAPVTQEKHRRVALNQTLGCRHARVPRDRFGERETKDGLPGSFARARERISKFDALSLCTAACEFC